jgi:hypothetical protein
MEHRLIPHIDDDMRFSASIYISASRAVHTRWTRLLVL